MRTSLEKQAAVLVPISNHAAGEEKLLLTLRAAHLSSHSGEVAFPGGKWEPGDPDLYYTALREANEEVGLVPAEVELITALEPCYTRAGTCVTPFVARVNADSPVYPNPDELADYFWFPLEILMNDQRVRTDIFEVAGEEYWAPVYEFSGYTIWGFTARVLVDLMARVYSIQLHREHAQAPEILFKRSS